MPQVTVGVKTGGTLPQNRSNILVALGSNMSSDVGSPIETLQKATSELENLGAVIRGKSRFFRTPAVPSGSGPDFVNAALAIDAPWSAPETITRLHEIEAGLGRRRAGRWEQRIIDLDLLAHGDAIRPNVATVRTWMELPLDKQRDTAPGQLLLPHPRMHERAFVLVPLADVAPDWVHPITRRSVVEMRDALPPEDLSMIVTAE
ncbi:2-amino-4-hydroxy-6-hydroxymethyldihydropteridine diphosphokinase [uncultured Tateyamaria sp.]|uniref:2-amino-4-hydroxy-6- hydroxymethyldihydropteridine diphosphokinase n=1 Tax=uncultured Tateyamaria sp. TaxID=455651 RepID=UPI002605D214|nr:2-amino-4-hydroxy-6-hydroxymethyldihydropteridine diphosphokinase [uncultured Tateyamaria sp.]